MTDARDGRADLHVHSLASDGVSSVAEILDQAERAGLDVIGITDHERIDAGIAARAMAEARGMRVQIVIGEEVTTRGGHVVGVFLRERIRPWGSLKTTVARIHEQGGLAIIPHPLVPYPLCASRRSIRKLMNEQDPLFHPDAIEAFNPTTARMRWARAVPAFATEVGLPAVAASDAHRAADIGQALILFPGRTPQDVRQAIIAGTISWEGRPYAWRRQLSLFLEQQHKNARAVGDEVRGKLLRDGTGRDLGYPGGRRRPARLDEDALRGEDSPRGADAPRGDAALRVEGRAK
jgi:predicted metal-dependent phosphoesterase TrpH